MEAAVHCQAYNSLTLVPVLNQRNAVYALPQYFSTTHFNVILQYMPRSSSGTNRVIKQTIKNKVQQCHFHPRRDIYEQSAQLTTSHTVHHIYEQSAQLTTSPIICTTFMNSQHN
jgi:hypothetical protein